MDKKGYGIKLLYGPENKPTRLSHTLLYSLQWVFIMFYPVVWGYAIVGINIGFTDNELAAYMSRVVLVIGLSTLFQILFGHQLSMVSGPNIIPSLAIVSAYSIGGKEYALQSFNAYIIAGIIVAALGFFGVISTISKVWSPLVQGAMLIIIGLTTSFSGMRMIAQYNASWPYFVGIFLALLCGWLSIKGKGLLSTIPVMIVIVLGYSIFILFQKFNWDIVNMMPTAAVPTLFPYGLEFPPMELIIMMTVVNLFSSINLYGNLQGYTEVLNIEFTKEREKKSLMVFGIAEGIVAGILGVPSHVALGENIGFLLLTRIASKYLLIIASILFIALSFFGKIGGFMAAMPEPVAGAILLGVASTLIGIGIDTLRIQKEFNTREIFIIGFSIFFSLGTSLLDIDFFNSTPRLVATLLNNPVILVITLVILLEKVIFRQGSLIIEKGKEK